MSAYFVTGAGTDIGKTYVACALLRAWRAMGLACEALKPVVSGHDDCAPEGGDVARLLEALGREANTENIAALAPWRFRAPLAPPLAAAAEERAIDLADVAAFCRARIEASRGVLLIEGAGGVMSPLARGATNLDLIAALGAPVIFVAGSYLGAVSHALTGLECIYARRVRVAMVIVSESADSAGLEETCAMIGAHAPDVAVKAVSRGAGAWAEIAARLAP